MKTTFPASILPSLTALAGLATLLPLPAYQVHEWGTFTTVAGSDGILLTGLQREEEHLPPFVHHHPGFAPGPRIAKAMPVPVRNVRVKMETPVIYFHSDEALQARVAVGFEGGTISQWYPMRRSGEKFTPGPASLLGLTAGNLLDFSRPYRGSIEWQVDVLSPQESRATSLFHPSDMLQWTHARVPEANVVRAANGETEGFLFYRGMGDFDPGLHTSIGSDETLRLGNRSGGAIPYLLVYEQLPDGSTRWLEVDGLAEGASLEVSEAELQRHDRADEGVVPAFLLINSATLRPVTKPFDRELFEALRDRLAEQGLLLSEAEAMVKTWWNSYFGKPGLRVFWVLPAERTDAILPLEIEPQPAKTVRVLVGRSEIIRPRQEKHWLAISGSGDPDESSHWSRIVSQDRFGLAYSERIHSLRQQASAR